MKWTVKDIEMYLQSKEYVDTVVVPLIPIAWEKDIKTTVSNGEFISLMTYEIERQFKGRIVLFPSFTYLKTESIKSKFEELQKWEKEIKSGESKNIFYITADVDWKQVENEFTETLIWLPAMPLEHVDDQYKETVIKEQMQQLMSIFMNKWKNE